MKKFFCMGMAVMLQGFFLLAMAAAEASASVVEAFDLTDILVAVIGLLAAVAGSVAVYAWQKWIRPWLEDRGLEEAAFIVVQAVEAIVGRYNGQDKWEIALQKMKARGWNIDSQKVLDALRAAWVNLDLAQMASGVKGQENQQAAE